MTNDEKAKLAILQAGDCPRCLSQGVDAIDLNGEVHYSCPHCGGGWTHHQETDTLETASL